MEEFLPRYQPLGPEMGASPHAPTPPMQDFCDNAEADLDILKDKIDDYEKIFDKVNKRSDNCSKIADILSSLVDSYNTILDIQYSSCDVDWAGIGLSDTYSVICRD